MERADDSAFGLDRWSRHLPSACKRSANQVSRASMQFPALSGVSLALQGLANAIRIPNVFGDVEYEVIAAKPGRPAVYAPDQPPEKFLAHLRRLGWVERNNSGRYGVTLLGEALLRRTRGMSQTLRILP